MTVSWFDNRPPILDHADQDSPSLFTADAMLTLAREARRLPPGVVPEVCVLDPDGDLERHLFSAGHLAPASHWACFHTSLHVCGSEHGIPRFGIIGRAVGAAFSVLLAEQLFASGCHFLISLSSAGQLVDLGAPPYFVVIDRALRDEGTSYHYLPASRFAHADRALLARMLPALQRTGLPLHVGGSWTTDAPFRETKGGISQRQAEGLLTVEMEAAGLYAFAEACRVPVLCVAHVTNRLCSDPGDFDKGQEGAAASLAVVVAAVHAWSDV